MFISKKNSSIRGKRIYMDYAATTPVDSEVFKAMEPYFTEIFGNASAIYQEGVNVKEALTTARKKIADILNVKNEEIIFTSGGTESNNLAILGVFTVLEEQGINIKKLHAITSVIEHPSVLKIFQALELKGLAVTYIKTDESGVIDAKDIRDATQDNTALVSIMYVNNEIGTVQPIQEIAKTLRHFRKINTTNRFINRNYPYLHTDASQAPLYFSLDVNKLHADIITLGGQKIYGPKGVGCLYKNKDIKISSIIKGGSQENGRRAGTENIPLIVGFAKALELAEKNRKREKERLTILRDYFIEGLKKNIPQAELNGSIKFRSPNNVNIYVPNMDGEFFTVLLDENGIACATKSACKESDEDIGSYVIEALGYSKERSKSSLRFSLGKTTSKKDIEYVIKVFREIVKKYSN